MKFCPECGAKLITQKFCQECGANISKYLNNKNNAESSGGLAGLDFSALENEASKQLKKQKALEKVKKDFEIKDGVLIKYKGKGGKVIVPKEVTVIGKSAFKALGGSSQVTEVVFEGKVTEIQSEAFMGCINLKSIKLPNTVTKIGDLAFCHAGMAEMTLPSNLKEIGASAFSYSKLRTITVPGGAMSGRAELTGNRGSIFNRCQNLQSVIFENGVTFIPMNMFCDCGALESVTIPNSVKSIENSAFCNCVSLKNVTIPYGVTTIRCASFENCRSLTKVNLPESITEIHPDAFRGCRSLTDITIPQNVTTIADHAFVDCVALERMQYNAKSAKISSDIFKNAGSESRGISVTFGASVVCVPDRLFKNCKISSISFENGSNCKRIGEYAFCMCSMVKSIQIPNSVTEIGSSAFANCESLTSVTLPPYLTEIASHTFVGCKNLQAITIPYGVRKIGEAAFTSCDSITSLEIPYSVTEIGDYALAISGKTTIKIPSHLVSHCFSEDYEFRRSDWRLIEY